MNERRWTTSWPGMACTLLVMVGVGTTTLSAQGAPQPGVYSGDRISLRIEEMGGAPFVTHFSVELPEDLADLTLDGQVTVGGDGSFMCPFENGLFDCGAGPLNTGEKVNIGRFNVFTITDGDLQAFADLNRRDDTGSVLPSFFEGVVTTVGGCEPDEDTLCLGDGGRFQVEGEWRRKGPVQPMRTGRHVGEDSGFLWFLAPDNIEVLVKVLDACGLNDNFWFFSAATTDVEYTLTVTDTVTGAFREYANPLGVASPAVTDTQAFATCP